ncbi:hypothetical protein [Sorangium sp. So ce1389]|uniref:hypothetical protein n=1 Tax=Sorangium sp. So ce1389 TaxID=3133336 RepID=UPI003F642012
MVAAATLSATFASQGLLRHAVGRVVAPPLLSVSCRLREVCRSRDAPLPLPLNLGQVAAVANLGQVAGVVGVLLPSPPWP